MQQTWRISTMLACSVGESAFHGFLAGAITLVCAHCLFLRWGSSFPVQTGFMIATVVGWLLHLPVRKWQFVKSTIHSIWSPGIWYALLGWGLCVPAMIAAIQPVLIDLSPALWSSAWNQCFVFTLVSIILWSVPLCVILTCFYHLAASQQTRFATGFSCALIFAPLMILPFTGIGLMLLLLSLVMSVALVLGSLQEPASIIQNEALESATSTSLSFHTPMTIISRVSMLIQIVCLCAILTIGFRIFSNLTMVAEYLISSAIGFTCLGFAIYAATCQTRWSAARFQQQAWLPWAICTLPACAILIFPTLIEWYLYASVYLRMTVLIIGFKLLPLISFYGVGGYLLGYACHALWPATSATRTTLLNASMEQCLCISLSICAVLGSSYLLLPILGVTSSLIGLMACCVVAGIPAWFPEVRQYCADILHSPSQPKFLRNCIQPVLCCAWCALILLMPLYQFRYQPERSAQLLFSSTTIGALRQGISRQDLPYLDGNRVKLRQESTRGTNTAWTYRDAQLQFRKSGMPSSLVSRDPSICPQFSAEMLTALLPMVLHDAPRKITILGSGGGVTAHVVTACPMMETTIVDPDLDFIRKLAGTKLVNWLNPTIKDQRVHACATDYPVAIYSCPVEQDVIILNPDHSAIHQNGACITAEFMQQVASHLHEDGMFSVRYTYADYGQQPIQSMFATLLSVFKDVSVMESSPGELVFVASMKSGKTVSPGIIQNLQTNQIRQLLGEIGWDWSLLMNLNFYDHATLKALRSSSTNNLWSGTQPFRDPIEAVTWNDKHAEITGLLDGRQNRLLAVFEQHPMKDEMLHRLSDIAARDKMIYEHPDEPWAYRKIVKERLQTKTRSSIETVKGEGLKKKIHPEDQRRMDYFEQLGDCLQKPDLTPTDILSLKQYTIPFDPLISYFVHNEMARMCVRTSPPDLKDELNCRLHMIYFGSINDRSVRDISRCLTILKELPSDQISADSRWEYSNALCEMLKLRWSMRRGGIAMLPGIEQSDLSESIKSVREVLKDYPEWGEAAGVSTVDTNGRVKSLERLLLRPLEEYRAERLKSLEETKAAANKPQS
jgi:spermidine synthase